jgi:hypothetical protein
VISPGKTGNSLSSISDLFRNFTTPKKGNPNFKYFRAGKLIKPEFSLSPDFFIMNIFNNLSTVLTNRPYNIQLISMNALFKYSEILFSDLYFLTMNEINRQFTGFKFTYHYLNKKYFYSN